MATFVATFNPTTSTVLGMKIIRRIQTFSLTSVREPGKVRVCKKIKFLLDLYTNVCMVSIPSIGCLSTNLVSPRTELRKIRSTMNLQYDEAQIEAMKTETVEGGENKALSLLNETLSEINKPTKIRAFTVFLNKDLATFLLKFNLKHPQVTNRPINWGIVDSMARQILNGHFRNTGEPLLFTDTGDGIDLQHRCHAVLKAAEIQPEAGYETTILTGIHVENTEALIDNLLVMGVAKRTKLNLAHFANVDSHKWEMVEYYMLPDSIKPGSISKALSKLEINDEYKMKRVYYDTMYASIVSLFMAHKQVNLELGEKRIPIYAAAALKMFDVDQEKGLQFMEAFFNPLDNMLPKGNPVDALRQEMVALIASGQRDKTRPIFIRRAMLKAFEEFFNGRVRTNWGTFFSPVEVKEPKQPRASRTMTTTKAAA